MMDGKWDGKGRVASGLAHHRVRARSVTLVTGVVKKKEKDGEL